MPQLHSFTFYISTHIDIRDLSYNFSRENIQHTLMHIKQQNTTSMVNYLCPYSVECSIFSLPFTFDYLDDLGNIFPNIVFDYVTYLSLNDNDAFKHEFFVRIARSFPLLKYLQIFNVESPVSAEIFTLLYNLSESESIIEYPSLLNVESPVLADLFTLSSNHSQSCSMIEYPHLMSLDISYGHTDYLEQFLNETMAYVPCLTELTVCHSQLKEVTKDFTREETRRNCAMVKRLIIIDPSNNSGDHSHYFPSL
jgi:hypothetical protein